MKKKALAILSALVVMAMGTMTVFGADSVDTGKVAEGQKAETSVVVDTPANYTNATKVSDGYTIETIDSTTVTSATAAVKSLLLNDLVKTTNTVTSEELKKAATTEGAKVSATILTAVDVEPTTAKKNDAGKYEFTISNKEITAKDLLAGLHWNEATNSWEQIAIKEQKDGSVTFLTDSLSPIAVVRLAVTLPASSASSSKTTSPKTGETAPVAAAIVVVALLGAAVTGKKYFA